MKTLKRTVYATVCTFLATSPVTIAGQAQNNTNQESGKKEFALPVINEDILQGRWDELKGKIKQQWAKITDDDLLKIKGSMQELHGILQQKYGYERARAEKEIREFLEKNNLNKEDQTQ